MPQVKPIPFLKGANKKDSNFLTKNLLINIFKFYSKKDNINLPLKSTSHLILFIISIFTYHSIDIL